MKILGFPSTPKQDTKRQTRARTHARTRAGK